MNLCYLIIIIIIIILCWFLWCLHSRKSIKRQTYSFLYELNRLVNKRECLSLSVSYVRSRSIKGFRKSHALEIRFRFGFPTLSTDRSIREKQSTGFRRRPLTRVTKLPTCYTPDHDQAYGRTHSPFSRSLVDAYLFAVHFGLFAQTRGPSSWRRSDHPLSSLIPCVLSHHSTLLHFAFLRFPSQHCFASSTRRSMYSRHKRSFEIFNPSFSHGDRHGISVFV